MIQGFFFDLDGTLVNTYRADYLAYRDAIEEVLGVDVAEADFAKTHGQEMRDKLESLAPGTTEAAAQKIAAAKKRHYKKYLGVTEPNEVLIRMLATLAEHHIMALVTTAKKQNALAVLKQHNLEKYFSHMVFGDELIHHKPHPEAYQLALERTGLKAHEVIAFEDSQTGIAAAEAAGIPVVRIRAFAP